MRIQSYPKSNTTGPRDEMISTWLCPGVRVFGVRFPYPTHPTALLALSVSYCTVRTPSLRRSLEAAGAGGPGGCRVEVVDMDFGGAGVAV